MQVSRKHHYIPAFYQKQWAAADGRVCAWSKPRDELICQKKHPNAVGFEKDLYAFDGLPETTRQWFEDTFLKHVDDLSAEALRSIDFQRTTAVDLRLRSAWSRFVMSLRFRHPNVISELKVLVAKIWSKRLEEARHDYAEHREEGDYATYEEYVASLSPETHAISHVRLIQGVLDNKKIGDRLNNMVWQIVEVHDPEFSFLTSDWPVIMRFQAPVPHILLPISPTKLFTAADDISFFQSLERLTAKDLTRFVNILVASKARRFVFNSSERQGACILKYFGTDMEPLPLIKVPEAFDLG